MYIENGIAYAGERVKPISVIGVRPLADYRLWLRFSTGETKICDLTSMLDSPAFKPLRDAEAFKAVYLDYGVPVWNDGDIDIAPEYLYEMAQPDEIQALNETQGETEFIPHDEVWD